jgi:hypothetical protein
MVALMTMAAIAVDGEGDGLMAIAVGGESKGGKTLDRWQRWGGGEVGRWWNCPLDKWTNFSRVRSQAGEIPLLPELNNRIDLSHFLSYHFVA